VWLVKSEDGETDSYHKLEEEEDDDYWFTV
jgi:hypothetical protein